MGIRGWIASTRRALSSGESLWAKLIVDMAIGYPCARQFHIISIFKLIFENKRRADFYQEHRNHPDFKSQEDPRKNITASQKLYNLHNKKRMKID